ncbi:hypothetical protein CPB85DRAFT_1569254 [Mucidula mucida]|nr:hypothetical protein CPB85DRAFT_1569254 [Mucidula mucida]
MASQTPRKTFKEVFPDTLPASATPPVHNTIVENHIAPFYALGWRFSKRELNCHFDAQSEWDQTMSPMSDSQTAWVNPRWRRYAKELPHYHRPMLHFMRNGDALYQITINFPPHMKTFKESEQKIIKAAVEALRLSEDKASELRWYRNGS